MRGFLGLGVLALFFLFCQAAQELVVFHAGSLSLPLARLGEAFCALHPEVHLSLEPSGSLVAARKVSELGREADLVISADWQVIEELLVPEHAAFLIRFARNEMVIAYTDRSLYSDEITPDNWYEVLLRDGVIFGHSDPDLDPCGYRTLLLWQLSELYYGVPGLYEELSARCPPGNTRPKAVELIALLESGDMDYAFEYRSVAAQHGLAFVELPPEINLGHPDQADFYAQAKVEIAGKAPGEAMEIRGTPIVYGLTIPYCAPHPELALEFVEFLLGPEGRRILEGCGQPPLVPPVASPGWEALPPPLKGLAVPERR
ncbi:MAG: Extracellular solute-binding protein family 1 [Acetothermia bacterium 64_32]|nr:MAG: Extracellular solute-binding protein family 1 [Acetothermia bacterium 64_32]HAF70495.1 tungstate ABC transporter substrate-binding protein WtpA [Candidatus Acetothermia bacterium]